jgi:hypothetical protein
MPVAKDIQETLASVAAGLALTGMARYGARQ